MNRIFKYGSKWVRADFHLHTDADKEFNLSGDNNNYIKDYVNKLKTENIGIGVITNHNKFNRHEFKKLKKEASENSIFLLPGVELSVADGSNGVHTLIVFNEEEWLINGEDTINQFLDSVFLGTNVNREHANARCKLSLLETIKALEDVGKGYFIIMAHIEDRAGFIEEFKGGRISEIAKEKIFFDNVIGFQKLRTFDNIKKLKDWMGYDIAFVEGSDPKSIDQIGKGEKCYLKLGEFTFDTVKFALKDFKNRVSSEEIENNRAYVKSIKFEGGKLDGKEVNLSKNLNTLIGIRGSGKSTILELLRYGLDIDFGNNSSDVEYKDGLVKNAITSGGKIIINLVDKHNNEYIVERIFGHDIHILDAKGEELGISLDTIITNPLYFGQKDLSQTEGYEEALLDKLIGNSKKEVNRKTESKSTELLDNVIKFIRLKDIEDDINENETTINNCNHKLELFEKYGINEKLENQVIYNDDKIHIEKTNLFLNENLAQIKESIKGKKEDISELLNYTSTLNKDIIDDLNININEVIRAIKVINEQIIRIEQIVNSKILDIEEKFKNKLKIVEEDFAEIKRDVESESPDLDLNDFMKYKTQLKQANDEIERLNKLKEERGDLKTTVKKNIRELNDLWLEEYKIYTKEIEKVNQRQDKLLISIGFKEDRKAFLENIKSSLQGSGLRSSDYQRIVQEYKDYLEIFMDIFLGKNKFKSLMGERSYIKSIEIFESKINELLTYKVPNKVNINYHEKPLSQHSIGQRASALILFILNQEENDLIMIDQPEDDLDNQVIYDELIKNIKERKDNIQFIFATHNANIPVLGDAEQVLACYYKDEKIKIRSGSIDKKEIQNRIIKIMEGGEDAFRRRNEIYKLWKYDL